MRQFVPIATALCAALFCAGTAGADALTDRVVEQHILPGYTDLASTTAEFAALAEQDCAPASEDLRDAWATAFDAWVATSHLRFGPSEVNNRAFAIAFWPDSRSKTPKALRSLLVDSDPVVETAARFATASVAVRGFYALEYLFYDTDYSSLGTPAYRCALVTAISRDLAANAAALLTDWQDGYADQMRQPGATADARYRSESEVHQELFKGLTTGLEILADMRLGRPLGSFDQPRPNRAEAYRSGRSLHHVQIQLAALRELAALLASEDRPLRQRLTAAFDRADQHAAALSDDPVFAGVSDPQQRFRIEALQQDVRNIKTIATAEIGPRLGVEAGFNALDGD